MHHWRAALLQLADLAERDFVREAGKVIALRNEALHRRAGGSRQHEEQGPGHSKDSGEQKYCENGQPPWEILQTAPHHATLLLSGGANLAAGERRNGEKQEHRQKAEEAEIGGKNRGCQEFQRSQDFQIREIPPGPGCQDFANQQEKNKMQKLSIVGLALVVAVSLAHAQTNSAEKPAAPVTSEIGISR